MAKSQQKNQAIKLREKGKSIKEIAKKLKISKSTVSLWCRDIELTPKQIQKLHEKMVRSGYKGRLKGARVQYERRLKKMREFEKEGIKKIGKLSDRNFLLTGLAIYWGEGNKKTRIVKITNSDPKMVKFMVKWFKEIWQIKNKRLNPYIGINKIHKNRIEEVEKYWSKITNVPRKQFGKTTLIKAKNKKAYKNFSIHYGTITIRIRKSGVLYYQIMGLIEGLKKAKR